MEDKNNLKNELDSFLNPSETISGDTKTIISDKAGLVERIDKKLVTEDGRQLLLERIY